MFKFFNSECNILHTRANKLSTNLKALCSCNHNQLTGFSTTFGCTKGNKTNVCKFNVIPKKFGRQRFAMHGKKNNTIFEHFLTKIANRVSQSAKLLVPLCYENMANHVSDAKSCKIGESCFAGVSVLSDFIAHCHFDKNDLQNGATFICSFMKKQFSPQKHCLNQYSSKLGGPPGVCFSLGTNSLLIEAASLERHSSTPMVESNPADPIRIALVMFLHKCINKPDHGSSKGISDPQILRYSCAPKIERPKMRKHRKLNICWFWFPIVLIPDVWD